MDSFLIEENIENSKLVIVERGYHLPYPKVLLEEFTGQQLNIFDYLISKLVTTMT